MARLMGVEIRNNKRIEIALTDIYGIGRTLAHVICDKANIDYSVKAKDLTDSQITALRDKPHSEETDFFVISNHFLLDILPCPSYSPYVGYRLESEVQSVTCSFFTFHSYPHH